MLYSGRRRLTCTSLIAAACLSAAIPAGAAITVNFQEGASLLSNPNSAVIISDFQRAADNWTSLFSNTFTFNLTIDFASLDPGVLADTNPTTTNYSYSSFYNALSANPNKSADDIQALSSLSNTTSFSRLINYTSNDPNGSGSSTPYVDNSQNALNITNANAKALGLYTGSPTATDASITFSSDFSFDFNPDDGISSGELDFVGVATHEIGHALGFISGVDVLDQHSSGTFFPSFAFDFVSPLDLFRYSSQSAATNGGIIDWTAGTSNKYFSLDKGATSIASFSTGVVHGDGSQASHWKDNLGIGIMDPTAAYGELLQISSTDIRAMDVIGYNLVSATAAPEPGSLALASLATPLLIGVVRRARRRR